jgi:hypothetical protein
MRILATVYLDGRLRAYGRANGAARASFFVRADRGQIAAAVHFRRKRDDFGGAKRYADLAPFAEFAGNDYLSFHQDHPKRVMNFREK